MITDLGSRFGTYQFVNSYNKLSDRKILQIGSLLFLEIESIYYLDNQDQDNMEINKKISNMCENNQIDVVKPDKHKREPVSYMVIKLHHVNEINTLVKKYLLPA